MSGSEPERLFVCARSVRTASFVVVAYLEPFRATMEPFPCVSNWKAFQGTQECRSNLVVSRSEWIMVTGLYKRQTTTYRILRRVACGAQLDEQTRLREVSRKETPMASEGSKEPRNLLFAALTDTPLSYTHMQERKATEKWRPLGCCALLRGCMGREQRGYKGRDWGIKTARSEGTRGHEGEDRSRQRRGVRLRPTAPGREVRGPS
jgi:hypothetical protein